MMATEHGVLIDYNWCTGCHTCEMACQMEHSYPIGQAGIKVFEYGPYQIEGTVWQYDYVPAFGTQCDRCKGRVEQGKLPSCVQHCQAKCMTYGTINELEQKFNCNDKQALFPF